MQPADVHRARRRAGPRSSTDCTTAASSSGGSVLGMQTTAVQPPSAAARAPVSIVSASSRPGSRKCTWMSTRPGATTQPSASSTSAPADGARPGADLGDHAVDDAHVGRPARPFSSTTRPPGAGTTLRQRDLPIRPATTARPCAPRRRSRPVRSRANGSSRRPRRRSRLPRFIGPGCITSVSGLSRAARSAVSPQRAEYSRSVGNRTSAPWPMSLELDAQQIHDVDVGQHIVEVVRHGDRPAVEPRRHQRGRTDERDVATEGAERGDVAARDARVRDVADDRDATPVERRAAVAAQRERVEQRLGRVLVPAVAGVDHAGRGPRRDPVRGAGRADDARRSRRHPSPRSSAPCRAGSRPSSPTTSRPRTSSCRRDEPLRRGLEREARAGRVLVEERHDRLAPQRRHLGDVALGHFDERSR